MANRTLDSARINLTATAGIKNTLDDGCTATSSVAFVQTTNFRDGVSENEFNRVWAQVGVALSDAASLTFDLTDFSGYDIGAGDGNDMLGQIMDLEELVFIAIRNDVTSTGSLQIEAGSSLANGVSWLPNNYQMPPNSTFIFSSPGEDGVFVSVLNKLFRITAQGGACNYSLFIFGRNDTEESSSSSSSSLSSQP